MIYKRKLKPFVIPMLYSVAFLAFVVSLYFLKKALDAPVFDEDDNYEYVTETIFENDIPVVETTKSIIRPYKDSEVKILKYFYDKDAESTKQQESIIYYENTYMQNSGVDYGGKDNFEVVAVLDGTIINVKDDNLLGKMVEIRHNNELISVYQSLSEVTVKQGDKVTQGQTIGKSGISNISINLKDHLHFEIIYNGKVLNPESVYDKTIKDL